MTALISAELLRLRTVRSTRLVALGVLVLVAVLAGMPVIDPAAGELPRRAELRDSLRSLALVGVIIAATIAASNLGTEFKRGSAAVTYLSHPRRGRVTAAHALVYAGVGFVLAGAAAGVVVAVGLPAADSQGADVGFAAIDVAREIGGAAFGGAVMGAAGALLGTLTRNPTVASGAVVGWNLGETLLQVAGVGPYLPFGLVGTSMGMGGDVPLVAAMALLLAYLAALSRLVCLWALPRDLA